MHQQRKQTINSNTENLSLQPNTICYLVYSVREPFLFAHSLSICPMFMCVLSFLSVLVVVLCSSLLISLLCFCSFRCFFSLNSDKFRIVDVDILEHATTTKHVNIAQYFFAFFSRARLFFFSFLLLSFVSFLVSRKICICLQRGKK